MFIHIHTHFETGQYVYLSETRAGGLGLPHFRIQGSQLSLDRRSHDQVSYFFVENGQRFLGSFDKIVYPGLPVGIQKRNPVAELSWVRCFFCR